MTKHFKRGLSLLLALLMICSMFATTLLQSFAATNKSYNPTVWVQGYADDSRTNFRVSQTLVVKTSGFAPNAKIEYTYYSTNTKDNFYVIGGHYGRTYNVRQHIALKAYIAEKPLTGNKLKDIGIKIANAGIKVANAALKVANAAITLDNAFYVESATTRATQFRLPGKSSSGYTIRVEAKDTNPGSATYNRVVSTSAGPFAGASLQKDLGAGLSLWAGEQKTTKQLLEDSGVAHINCDLSLIPLCFIYNYPDSNAITPSNAEYKNANAVITGVTWGKTARLSLNVTKLLCAYHIAQSGTGGSYIHVFRQPTVTPITGGFEITNTEAGVIYSAGEQSYECKQDGEKVVLRDLCPNCEYEITLSHKNPDGRYSRKYVYAVTPPPMYAYLHYATGLAGLIHAPEHTIDNKGDPCTYPINPTAYGAMITNWYTDVALTQPYDFSQKVYQSFDLYGKWEQLKSSVTLNLTAKGSVVTDETVELYQNGSLVYTLEETKTKGTYYIKDSVVNDTYDLYINGLDTKYDLFVQTKRTENNLNATQKAQLISGDNLRYNINLNKLETITRLDGVVTKLDGATIEYFEPTGARATVYKNNTYYTYFAESDTTVYDIYYNGRDTDEIDGDSTKNIDKNNSLRYLDFYNVTVNAITDDADWVCDNMVLRNENGKFIAKLTAGEYDSKTGSRPYTAIMLKDEKNPATDLYIYVDGNNSLRTLRATEADKITDISFITSEITVNQDNAAKTNAELFFNDGINNATVTANENGVYTAHLVDNNADYTVSVTGTKDTATHTVNKTDRDLTLNFFTQTFMSSEYNENTPVYNEFKYREYIVYEGEVIAAPTGVYLDGVTFNCWNTDKYQPDEAAQQGFDFSLPITDTHTFYAHFKAPTVEINGFVKTDAEGNLNSTGNSYMMPNLVITGYDEDAAMQSAKISFTEIISAKIPVADVATMETKSGTLPETVGEYYVLSDDDTLVINLNNAITPNEMREWFRGIIVTPEQEIENTVKFEISDGVSSKYTKEDWAYPNEYDVDEYTALTDLSAGQTLTTGNYSIEGDIVLDGTQNGTNGLVIDGKVKLYIPEGSSLTAIGANSDGIAGGKAGILIPEDSEFTVIGDGALTAKGGKAGNGADGESASATGTTIARYSGYDVYTSDYGGAGGNGGGGAGAGIGTNGGDGGAGGERNTLEQQTINYTQFAHNFTVGGTAGQAGGDGSDAAVCGKFYSYGVTVDAWGGDSGTNGTGGIAKAQIEAGSISTTGSGTCVYYYVNYAGVNWLPCATASGAGGAGGGGWSATDVGTGGTGGAGGGAGALGAYHVANMGVSGYKNRVYAPGGNPGAGANGTAGNKGGDGAGGTEIITNSAALGGASVNNITEIKKDDYSKVEAYTRVTSLSVGQTLKSGNYYIDGQFELDGRTINSNGLVIDGDVKLYIPSGSSITVYGADGNGMTGGKAAILLPSSSDLTVLGNGDLTVQGGKAGNATAGTNATGCYFVWGNGFIHCQNACGGGGGNGGGGAGAGIGTDGGAGGAGGWAPGRISVPLYCSNFCDGYNVRGYAGGNGGAGAASESCGDFKCYGVNLNAKGGTQGFAGSKGYTKTGWGYPNLTGAPWECNVGCGITSWDIYDITMTCGSGGGGGGAGYSGYAVGTGGAGGGGGGAGTTGGVFVGVYWSWAYQYYYAGGGGGGAGAVTGEAGQNNGYGFQPQYRPAAVGGASDRSTAKEITYAQYTYPSEPKYTVTFDASAFGTTKTVDSYKYFTQTTITVPDLTTPAGLFFKGWVVTDCASNLNGDKTPLCGNDTTYYQPEQSIVIDANTSGNVTLKPVFEIIKSKTGKGSMTIADDVFVPEPTPITYYTYSVTTTLNGVATDIGNITLKNGDKEYVLEPKGDGNYSIVISEDISFSVFYDGKDTGKTVSSESPAALALSSVTVNTKLDGALDGKLGDVLLKGKKSVALSPVLNGNINTGVYKTVGLSSEFEDSYEVFIGNTDTGITVAPTEEKDVNYVTVKVALKGNTTPESAYIADEDNNRIILDVGIDELSAITLYNDKPYSLYVNGLNADTTVYLNDENTATVNTVLVSISLDGEVCDVNGYVPYYDGFAMEKVDDGEYSTLIFSAPGKVSVKDRELTPEADCTLAVKLYTVTYDLGDGTGVTPIDGRIYFDGDIATVTSEKSIFGDGSEFAGWTYNSKDYVAGDLVDIADTVVMCARYLSASEFDLMVTINGETHYYMFDQLETLLENRKEGDIVEITILKNWYAVPAITLEEEDRLTIAENVTVTIPEDNTLVNNGTIEVLGGAKLTLPEEFTNNGTLTLSENAQLTSPADSSFTNNGTVKSLEGSKITTSGKFVNFGKVENNGEFVYNGTEFRNAINPVNAATATFDNNGVLFIDAPNAINEGTLNNLGSESYDGTGPEPTHARIESNSEPVNSLKNNGTIYSEGGYIDLKIDNYAIEDGNHVNGVVNNGTCIDDGMVFGPTANEVKNNEEGEKQTKEEDKRIADKLDEEQKKAAEEAAKEKEDAQGKKVNYYLLPEGGSFTKKCSVYNEKTGEYEEKDVEFDDTKDQNFTYTVGGETVEGKLEKQPTALPNNIYKNGYKFLGWCNSKDITIDLETGDVILGDTTMQIGVDEYEELYFYAKWEEVTQYNGNQEEQKVNIIPDQETTLTKKFTSDVATDVGGLENELTVLAKDNPEAEKIDVDYKLKEEKDPVKQASENYQEVLEEVEGNTKQYLDFDYTLKINGVDQDVNQSNKVLESIIPFNTFTQSNPSIARYHDGEVNKFKESHSHEDGTFEIVGSGVNAELHIYANKFCEGILAYDMKDSPITEDTKCQANITLNENITVGLRVVGYDATKSDNDLFAVTVDGEKVETSVGDNGGNPCIEATLKSFRPSEMGNSVHVIVTYDGGMVKEFDYSIVNYCNKVLSLPGYVGTKLAALCEAVLGYGAAADDYLNDKNDSTIDAGHEFKPDAYTIAQPAVAADAGYNTNVTAASASLGFDNTVNLYFTITSKIVLNEWLVHITNEEGKYLDPAVDYDVEDIGGGQYRVCICNIGAARMNRTYNLKLNGVSLFFIKYSVANYCYNKVKSIQEDIDVAKAEADALGMSYSPDMSDTNLINLCKAIDNYANAAKDYAGK